jgi:hypothetical protein
MHDPFVYNVITKRGHGMQSGRRADMVHTRGRQYRCPKSWEGMQLRDAQSNVLPGPSIVTRAPQTSKGQGGTVDEHRFRLSFTAVRFTGR